MIKLKSEQISGIFLRHDILIKEAYNNYIKETETSKVHEENEIISVYVLKPDLFIYEENNKGKSKSSRKRKRKLSLLFEKCDKNNEITNDQDETITKIYKIKEASKFLTNLIKDQQLFNMKMNSNLKDNGNNYNSFLSIFINKKYPKFNGENLTKKNILYEMNNNTYLIPSNCIFFNYDIRELPTIINKLDKYDLIIMDPPWKNKYIRRIKNFQTDYSYDMLDNQIIADIPIKLLIKKYSIVCIWCTNSRQHQNNIINNILPLWNLKLLKKLYWIKLNKYGNVICDFNEPGQKQPYECFYMAINNDCDENDHNEFMAKCSQLKNDIADYILSTPSVVHSHKPPLYEIFKNYLPNKAKCLELFARYLYPNFTSIGLEVLKLMDLRFYDCISMKN